MKRFWLIVFIVSFVQPGTYGGQNNPDTNDQSHMSYLDNGVIRLGVNLELGGSITSLADAAKKVNIINNHDWGRQIQMSFYSGPNPYTPDGKQPREDWKMLGWNPIQSGDCYGNRSQVLEHRNDGNSIYIKSIPMHWPLDDVPGECTFETWIRLEGHTAAVRSRINNRRPDTTMYRGRSQELPAIYTNGPWYQLMTYDGDKPFTNDTLRRITKRWGAGLPETNGRWDHWHATENWAALLNDSGWGVGVWKPGTYSFAGGFFGRPGRGGSQDSPTGYISPVEREILDHNITYEYSYTLIVGKLEDIRGWVYEHANRKRLPDYRFETDRQHWIYHNVTDSGWPVRGELRLRITENDPQLIGPADFWQAEDVPTLYIHAAFATRHDQAELFWKTKTEPHFSAEKKITFRIVPDGDYRWYKLDPGSHPLYEGAVTRLRLDPVPAGADGDVLRLKAITHKKP